MASLPITLGYNDPDVDGRGERATCSWVPFFPSPIRIEMEVAETIIAMVPCAEKVRFGKNGSDATAGAIRVARAHTGRDHIAVCGYHGWQDWYIGSTARNLGVPVAVRELTHGFQYNDIASLEKVFQSHRDQVAAVILEPMNVVAPDAGLPRRGQGHRPSSRRAVYLRRDYHRLPLRQWRRPGTVRRHARPGLLRQGTGQRLPAVGGRRPRRPDEVDGGNILLLHLRRRDPVAGGLPGDAAQTTRENPSSQPCSSAAVS